MNVMKNKWLINFYKNGDKEMYMENIYHVHIDKEGNEQKYATIVADSGKTDGSGNLMRQCKECKEVLEPTINPGKTYYIGDDGKLGNGETWFASLKIVIKHKTIPVIQINKIFHKHAESGNLNESTARDRFVGDITYTCSACERECMISDAAYIEIG